MRTIHNDVNTQFTVGNTRIHVVSLIFERFLRTVPGHSHGSGSYEIHCITSGYGRAQIDGVFYDITPGTVYVTGPHVEHAQAPSAEDPMCEYCVYLKAEHRAAVKTDDRDNWFGLIETTPFWFGRDSQGIGDIMCALLYELEKRSSGWETETEALFKQLLVHLARNMEQKKAPEKRSGSSGITDKTSVIIEDYFLYEYQNLSLEELAGRLSLSTRQTERLLKKHYGKTFLQKKTEARMSAAAILLTNEKLSITTIAENLGYSSIEHFSTAFKSCYHMSPRQYRKNQKEDPSVYPYQSFPLIAGSGFSNR